MSSKSTITCAALVLLLQAPAFTQKPDQQVNVAPNAPSDKPVGTTKDEVRQFEEAIKPYVGLARRTYPEARDRFLKGLPSKHTFFVTTRLHDPTGRFEQVFVAVREIKDGRITGLIWSDVQLIPGYKHGDSYTFPESELIDWMISRPDGTEEGNFVGKFLDTYRPQHAAEGPRWRETPATPEGMSRRIEEAAVRYQSSAPIPRVVLYDIGYPRDEREYAALDGNAVILLTALTQEKGELPLRRVYVSESSKEVELKPLKLVLSEQQAGGGAAARTFGPYRADALYLLPMYLRVKAADLMVDFGAGRTGFKVATFGTPVSDEVGRLNVKAPAGAGPS